MADVAGKKRQEKQDAQDTGKNAGGRAAMEERGAQENRDAQEAREQQSRQDARGEQDIRGEQGAQNAEEDYQARSELLWENGFQLSFVTMYHNSPPHWHRALEILYMLNGRAQVNMDGKTYQLNPLDFLVIDAEKVHDVICAPPQSMGVRLHISKAYMRRFLPQLDRLSFACCSAGTDLGQDASCRRLCGYLKELTVVNFTQTRSWKLKTNALVLEILAELTERHSVENDAAGAWNAERLTRMEQICAYAEKYHAQPLSLQQAASEIGLNREYFCRFFKSNMGVPFVRYLNELRIHHIYQDLLETDEGIQALAEKHGFFNQKLFYRMFKEIYGCTPRALRSMAAKNPCPPRRSEN